MGRNLKSSRQPLHVRLNICLRLLLSLDPPSLSPRLRNLGVLFDTSMSFISTCNSILNCADVISVASPKQLMSPLVSSSVDYCNCWTGSEGSEVLPPLYSISGRLTIPRTRHLLVARWGSHGIQDRHTLLSCCPLALVSVCARVAIAASQISLLARFQLHISD